MESGCTRRDFGRDVQPAIPNRPRCWSLVGPMFGAIRMWVPKGLGMIRRLTNGSAWALTKGVASCDKLRVGARGLRSGDTRMGLPTTGHTVELPYGRRNPPNGSIQVGGGRETKMGFPD
jgi:hypothetical protein